MANGIRRQPRIRGACCAEIHRTARPCRRNTAWIFATIVIIGQLDAFSSERVVQHRGDRAVRACCFDSRTSSASPLISPGYFDLLLTGFLRYDWPWRIVCALRVIAQSRGMPPDNRLHGEGVYVWSDAPLRRWGATESILQPSFHASPLGPAPIADSGCPCPAGTSSGARPAVTTARNDPARLKGASSYGRPF